jgi:hypothetical protein
MATRKERSGDRMAAKVHSRNDERPGRLPRPFDLQV